MSTETPDPISIKRVKEITGLSKATIWRRIADGTLQVASGSGPDRKNLVIGTSVQRFIQPRA